MQVREVFGREAPLDFGIAGERAGARAGDVGENAMVWIGEGEIGGVGDQRCDVVLRAAD